MKTGQTPEAIDAALDRLGALHPKLIDLSLDRIHRLLARLDHPERSLPPIVHVAGTNGKGSTVAFLNAMAAQAGLSVHAYTSPHLVRFNERIQVAGQAIDDDRLLDVLERCERANDGADITYFEITTVAAFLAFAETPADLTLLEVGLGGRLDATNVIDRPVATAITCISLDHQDFLGDSVEAIAREKAGILKPGVPAVIGPQPFEAAADALDREIALTGVIADRHGRDWFHRRTGDALILTDRDGETSWPLPSLPGAHQLANAATALRLARHLEMLSANTEAQAAGLTHAQWPARLQRLTTGPLVEALPTDEVWLDGAHNDTAGAALASWLEDLPTRPTTALVALLTTKDPTAVLSPLVGKVDRLIVVPIIGSAVAAKPEQLAAKAKAIGFADVDWVADMKDAPHRVIPGGRVVIFGSLYLAGEVLAENG
ncbi:MAG: folylpolyglutamate synthase/dihydrofolate synthase family protein [Pseudomonadota bacterium]